MEVKIESKGEDRQSSIFYGNEDSGMTTIAEAEDKHGNKYCLIATGEIQMEFEGQIYKNGYIEDLIHEQGMTDKDLNSEEVTFYNNNWFEVIFKPKDSDSFNSEIGRVRHTYDEGIGLLEQYVSECYAEPQNQSEVKA
jgi:hypothetical protein